MNVIHTLNKKLTLIIFLCGITQEILTDTANIINNRHHSRKVSRSRSTKSPYIIILAGQLDMRQQSNTVRNISITAATLPYCPEKPAREACAACRRTLQEGS